MDCHAAPIGARPQLESLGALSRRVQAGSKKGQGVHQTWPGPRIAKGRGALRDPQSKRHGRASVSEKEKGPQQSGTPHQRAALVPDTKEGFRPCQRNPAPAPDEADLETNIAPDALCDDLRRRDQPPEPPFPCRHATGRCRWEVVSLRRPTAAPSSIRSPTRIRNTSSDYEREIDRLDGAVRPR